LIDDHIIIDKIQLAVVLKPKEPTKIIECGWINPKFTSEGDFMLDSQGSKFEHQKQDSEKSEEKVLMIEEDNNRFKVGDKNKKLQYVYDKSGCCQEYQDIFVNVFANGRKTYLSTTNEGPTDPLSTLALIPTPLVLVPSQTAFYRECTH
uniref:Retrovirus-related Pol polyprotein from transposon TNT 1-94 n=1 Tax=Anisakis simplex TaxID=6269 RepID=A0A0M3KBT3_ANISI